MTWDLLQANRSVLISGPELVRDLCFFVVSRTHLIAVPAGNPTWTRCEGETTKVWSPLITSYALGSRSSG